MSCNLILMESDRIIMCADSAVSTTLMGTVYRVDESGKKIYTFDNKIILFLCGKMRLIYNVANRFKLSEHTIENLRSILQDEYNKETDGVKEEFVISAIVGIMESDKAVMYDISDYNDFEITRIEGSPLGVGVYAAGIKCEECIEIASRYINQKNEVRDVYRMTMNELSFEGIGGTLTVYCLDKKGIKLLMKEKIKEKNNIRRIYDKQTVSKEIIKNMHCVMANTLVGKAILGTKMTLADEDGQFDINGKNLTIKDNTKISVSNFGNFDNINSIYMEETINE